MSHRTTESPNVSVDQGASAKRQTIDPGDSRSLEFQTCPLCAELRTQDNTQMQKQLGRPAPDRILYCDPILTLIPDISPITPGHLLLTSNCHILSFAELTKTEIRATWNFLEKLREQLTAVYGPIAIFEHGSAGTHTRQGSCIEHAHIHAIPSCGCDFTQNISAKINTKPDELRDFTDLRDFSGEPYLMYANEEHIYVWRPPSGTASQVIRQTAWEGVSSGQGHWDWALPLIGGEILEDTLAKLAFLRDG